MGRQRVCRVAEARREQAFLGASRYADERMKKEEKKKTSREQSESSPGRILPTRESSRVMLISREHESSSAGTCENVKEEPRASLSYSSVAPRTTPAKSVCFIINIFQIFLMLYTLYRQVRVDFATTLSVAICKELNYILKTLEIYI